MNQGDQKMLEFVNSAKKLKNACDLQIRIEILQECTAVTSI